MALILLIGLVEPRGDASTPSTGIAAGKGVTARVRVRVRVGVRGRSRGRASRLARA